MIRRIVYICLAAALVAFSLWAFSFGFTKLSEVRQLDRLPNTPIAALTEGVYALDGTIEEANNAIIAPYSKTPVVFYAYKLEETYTDSDGDQKTRTLESGKSATPFTLADTSGEVRVQPGFALQQIKISAPETYRRKDGDLTYTEHTLAAENQIQLTGHYDPKSAELKLSQTDGSVPKIITTQTLAREGGQSLFWIGMIISAAVGALAVGVAFILTGFAVHRFWVFVLVMTVGIMAALATLGIRAVQIDWQHAAQLYSQRSQAALSQPKNSYAQEDLFRYYLLLKQSAQGWPDHALFENFARSNLDLPVLTDTRQQALIAQIAVKASSRFENSWITYLVCLIAVFVCVGLIWAALVAIRFKRLVEFIPTSKTTGLTYGIAELFGIVQTNTEAPVLRSQLNQKDCVAYRYSIEERRGSGKNQKWVEIESGDESVNFWLEDNLGRVSINPNQATIKYPEKLIKQEGSRRYSEYWLAPLTEVYCLGFAGFDDQQPSTLVMQNSEDIDLLLTAEDEQKVILGQGAKGFLLTGLALAFGLMAGTVWLAGSGSFTPLDLLSVSLLVPVLLLLITVVMHYNSLVFLRQRVSKTAADIDTLLQKRHDLWPRIQETVKGYLAHESALLESISLVRSGRASVQDSADNASRHLKVEEKTVGKLVALTEQYPELKANKVMQQFTQQMERSEDELALIRQGYNDSVTLYNTQIEKLPDVILARVFGFKAAAIFRQMEAN
ncbi:LemA family protein [Reinekea sp.]|uniref:LemA family protein n=1 Tax=Reinekea sp. TaxID=1970455 RepID=UPI0039895D2D